MNKTVKINDKIIGNDFPVYIIAEMSANHGGNFNNAIKIIRKAKECGADCIKIQTYTADTLTIDCDNDYFNIKEGTWVGKNLYSLYKEAFTPWEWHQDLKLEAENLGLDFLSTAYDPSSVDFLESLDIKFYKIASFELIDLPLIKYIASKKKPIIISTGMGSLDEIKESVLAVKETGNKNLCLLKCTSAYPSSLENLNLHTISHLKKTFDIPIGLSDHSLSSLSAIIAVSLGANIIEKHLCLTRKLKTPDSTFSMEPREFEKMIKKIRLTEKALGKIRYQISEEEKVSKSHRKSIFITENMKKGEIISEKNIRIIRPGQGLAPKFYKELIGRKINRNLKRGTPLSLDLLEK